MTVAGLPEKVADPNLLPADALPAPPQPPSLSSSSERLPASELDSTQVSGVSGEPGAADSAPEEDKLSAGAKGSGPGVGPKGEHRQVGRYRIKNRVGRGGMAAVFRAEDPSIGRDVAIKFLHASLCEDEESRVRFLREARAAGGLSHPNIVVVHDVGEVDRRPYMAMELIDGAPLSDVLSERSTLPVRDVVLIGLQLARALEYAHGRGVVHRDIKPSNIMFLRDGKTVKVADFGIASMDDGSGEQRTIAGTVMGTPQYMSPEQTRGDKLDGRSDLLVDTSQKPWRAVAADGGPAPVSAADIAQFQRAAAIRDAFFPAALPGQASNALRFDLVPLALDSSGRGAVLDVEGAKTVLSPGAAPGRAAQLQWPARGAVSLSFDGEPAGSALVADGPWAALRFVARGKVAPTAVPERVRVSLQQGARTADFELRASSIVHPFALRELAEFRCPQLAP